MKVSFAKAAHSDAETLVQMRIEAMRESLQRIGRFDPQRARDRFMSSFDPTWCRFIVAGDVFENRRDRLRYLLPEGTPKTWGESVGCPSA